MPIAKVSSKGQITLPVHARKLAGIRPHDRVLIETEGDTILIRAVPDFGRLSGFLGKAQSPGRERKAVSEALAEHVEKPR